MRAYMRGDSTGTGGVAAEGDLNGDSDGEVRAVGRTAGSKEPRRGARCTEGGAAP